MMQMIILIDYESNYIIINIQINDLMMFQIRKVTIIT